MGIHKYRRTTGPHNTSFAEYLRLFAILVLAIVLVLIILI